MLEWNFMILLILEIGTNRSMDNQDYLCYRNFGLTLISAKNLPNVRKYFKPKVYAKVTFCGDKKTEKRTLADKHGESNPAWNYTLKYKIDESGIAQYGLQLVIKLYCKRTLGDRFVGKIYKSMKELFDDAQSSGGSAVLSLPIKKGSEETGGRLTFSYKFGEIIQEKKPGFFKRILLPGACILFSVVTLATVGVGVPYVPFDGQHDIVHPDELNEKK
ncbi:protein SRC2-like [Olea europaea var. sylvestris]|uniref:protein SRC2-like n=1 Tax=Olea europaea var. sylvestris TaxID=158386 RepID=UPI000C1D290B|nr:protein SRC2-like [Olea europaea var. sylvestris]